MKMSIDEIVKEVRKNINKSIVENRHLLNEKWSYSSDVEEAEINNEELATVDKYNKKNRKYNE